MRKGSKPRASGLKDGILAAPPSKAGEPVTLAVLRPGTDTVLDLPATEDI